MSLHDELPALADVALVFWLCPVRHQRPRQLMTTVKWDDDGVAHCTQCPMTSEQHYARLAWSLGPAT